jgi:hypothetical protein
MAVYADAEQVYDCFRTLFEEIEIKEPQAAEKLLAAQLAIRFRCSGPAVEIVIDARQRPVQILYGNNGVTPQVDVAMAADTLHCLLLGELKLTKAIGSGLIKPRGPILKTLALADLFQHARFLYPAVAQQYGLPARC